ncbi:hypothetical protein ILUMI_03218 [Ignelater luminosus]|uniref:Uncharacterized protein n=1 Tax=Ignelater luminosus TaxID=2038154 RepID=A0A8K0GFQ7_IGNLU|nr:hypothetical protein ILUMI_03218 [Ignelater luminosus]
MQWYIKDPSTMRRRNKEKATRRKIKISELRIEDKQNKYQKKLEEKFTQVLSPHVETDNLEESWHRFKTSGKKLDHALPYSKEIEKVEMDNEAIKNNEYAPNEADENNDHPTIENEEDDDYIPLETNASSGNNSLSTGNDEEAKIDDKTNRVQKKKEKRKVRKTFSKSATKADKETPKQNDYQKVVIVDLAKRLPSPVLINSQSFYSLKLWSFNYTIYDANEKVANCMMWDELISGRGGNEMASCMLKYITKRNCPDDHVLLSPSAYSSTPQAEEPGIPFFKTDFDEISEFEGVDYNRKVSRNNAIYDTLDKVTEEEHLISKEKSTMTCRNEWVPTRFHQFYEDLRYE